MFSGLRGVGHGCRSCALCLIFVAGESLAREGMRLPGSPVCKEDASSLSASDVLDWKEYADSVVPPLNRIGTTGRNTEPAKLTAELARNRYISAAYLDMCRDRVMDRGTCTEKADPGFLWACAAARGSYTAGQYMEQGLITAKSEAKAGLAGKLLGDKGVLPAVALLGKANGKIFDDVGWHHFAAAKCGANFAASLLNVSSSPRRDQYMDYWIRTQQAQPESRVAGTPVELLLEVEQRLIQPGMQENKLLLSALTRSGMIQSGVGGAKGLLPFVTENLKLGASQANLASYSQRFRWERDHVVPKILEDVLRAGCAGMGRLNTIAQILREKQNDEAEKFSGLREFRRVNPKATPESSTSGVLAHSEPDAHPQGHQ